MNPKAKKSLLDLLPAGRRISGTRLAERLGVSRQALHKQVRALRREGYRIVGKTGSGYALTRQPDLWNAEQIGAGRVVGKRILAFSRIGSTQDEVKRLAEGGEPEGALVLAESQGKGRGRRGRSWSSEPGGIWGSFLLRPKIAPQKVPQLSLALALSIAKAVESRLGVPCKVKWPNDVWARKGGRYAKFCGVLAEMSAELDRALWVALGFGINANNRLPPLLRKEAVSLSEAAGSPVERGPLLSAVVKFFDSDYRRFLRKGLPGFKREYEKRSGLRPGDRIAIEDGGPPRRGTYRGISSDGALRARMENGRTESYYAGDVSLLNSNNKKRMY